MVQYRRASLSDVKTLSRMRHNNELCPLLQRRCEQVVSCLERHHTIVYDVQGPRDAGVDVVVRVSEGENAEYIGFQVKADDEAKPGVYEKLKAQWVDAKSQYGDSLTDYFILLAWDPEKRQAQVRSVEQSFVGIPGIKIIEPAFAATFLIAASASQISALTSAFMSEEDPLLLEARKPIAGMNRRQAALFVEVLARFIEGGPASTTDSLRQAAFVDSAYADTQAMWFHKGVVLPPGLQQPDEELPEAGGDPFELYLEDLERLEEEIDRPDDEFQVGADLEAVLAVSYDLKARHRLGGLQLREGLLELLSASGTRTLGDIADELLDAFWRSPMSQSEQIDLLALILRRNHPEIAEGGVLRGAEEPFDPDHLTSWLDVAETLLDGDA